MPQDTQSYGQATAFIIEQLTGGPQATQVVLRDRALPYRPITIGGSMRATMDWYPGNPDATVQFLGPEEDQIVVRGMWKDRFIVGASLNTGGARVPTAAVNGNQVSDAFTLVDTFHVMRRQGRPIRLTWDEIIREGYISKFVATYERREDIEWELTLAITSWGDKPAYAILSSQTDLTSSISAWLKTQNDLEDSKANTPFQRVQDLADQLDEAVQKLEDSINDVVDSISAVTDTFLSAAANARRLAGIAQAVQDAADGIIDTLSEQPPIDLFIVPGLTQALNPPTYGDELTAQLWTTNLADIARTAKYNAAAQQQQFLAQVQPTLIGKFIAQEGMDLRLVSNAFYGTPDQWPSLMMFNGFTSSGLNAGDVVLVPALSAIGVDPSSPSGSA